MPEHVLMRKEEKMFNQNSLNIFKQSEKFNIVGYDPVCIIKIY